MVSSINGNPLTNLVTFVVCGIIVILFIVSLVSRVRAYQNKNSVDPITAIAPGVSIAIGIFGTFLGIYLGLRDFNTSDINNSIPSLLDGLKMAFLTSLMGMIISVLLKYVYSFFEKKDSARTSIASEDPAVLLRHISANINTLTRTVVVVGKTVSKLLASDGDTSLISQLKFIRTEMHDLSREVTNTLRDFGEKVAELGTESMIKALREVIDQFNAHLNDLVGEEFKQLKEAMIELNDWQKNYRESVDKMQTQLSEYLSNVKLSVELLEKAANSMGKAGDNLDSIDGSLSTISVSADDIQHHIENLKLHSQQLGEFIDQISRLGEEAKDVLPTIAKHINDSTSKLVTAAEEAKTNIIGAGDSLGETVEGVSDKMFELTKQHADQANTTIDQTKTLLNDVLTKSLESLAGQLASLSNKFAEDYTPLTEKLREVVSLAERVNDERI